MNQKPVLVIMAAGMGSRYGGLKQIDPVDEYGHLIIDFSLYDAIEAGFEKVIFIIKRAIEAEFKEHIGNRIAKQMEVEYVFQELELLPEGYSIPEGRQKPWGTGHALLCCAPYIQTPFAVINADDYYGKSAFRTIYHQLCTMQDDDICHYTMVGYSLYHTLTEHGHVARGICSVDKQGMLTDIRERTHIEQRGDTACYTEDNGKTWNPLARETIVSMNLWGFTPSIFPELQQRFAVFLSQQLPLNPHKEEFFLPFTVNEMLSEGKAEVSVLTSSDHWYGVTYKEDKEKVTAAIRSLKEQKQYPKQLWKEV